MQFRPTPEDVLGFLMTAYYGGRAECHIRHVLTRIAYCDVRSMYPTINVLMGLWGSCIAERIEVYDALDRVRDFLTYVTLEDLLRPEAWRRLPFLVLIHPRDDRLPVRTQYIDGGDYQVGFNYLTSDVPIWCTLADAVASKLQTGRVPEVVAALGFRPIGLNPHLRPVRFRGEVEIDPAREDFIKRLVEERQRYREAAKQARARGLLLEGAHAAAMEAGLKMTANSTAYGTPIELIRRSGQTLRALRVHGLYGFETKSRAWEQTGRFFHPLIGVMVTGGARLVLTLLELAAKQLGADYAMMDTDSLAIAATELAPDPLAVAEPLAVRFTGLNPFSFGGSILKIEDENFTLCEPDNPEKGVDHSKPEALYYYGIAAKRYALCNVTDGRKVLLRKYSEHGLGHLLSPIPRERDGSELIPPEPDESDGRTALVTPGRGRQWIGELWQAIIESTLAGRKGVPRFPWSDLPALGRFSVSQPSLFKLAKGWNAVRRGRKWIPKPFAQQVKPTNFLLVAYLDTGTLIREAYREPHGSLTGTQPIRPVAPYDPNPANWPKLPWRDLHTGEPIKLTWSKKRTYSVSELPVQTYHNVTARYLRHPEVKAAGGDGVGMLQPLHVAVTDAHQIRHIGKEANRLDEVQVFGLQADTYLHYQDEDAHKEWLRQKVETIPRKLVSRYAGLGERQIARFLSGKSGVRKNAMSRLVRMVEIWEKVWGDEDSFVRVMAPQERSIVQ